VWRRESKVHLREERGAAALAVFFWDMPSPFPATHRSYVLKVEFLGEPFLRPLAALPRRFELVIPEILGHGRVFPSA